MVLQYYAVLCTAATLTSVCCCTPYEYNWDRSQVRSPVPTPGEPPGIFCCRGLWGRRDKTMLACLAYCEMRPGVVQYPDTASSILVLGHTIYFSCILVVWPLECRVSVTVCEDVSLRPALHSDLCVSVRAKLSLTTRCVVRPRLL